MNYRIVLKNKFGAILNVRIIMFDPDGSYTRKGMVDVIFSITKFNPGDRISVEEYHHESV